jgi:hypothetical protein
MARPVEVGGSGQRFSLDQDQGPTGIFLLLKISGSLWR